MIQHMKLQNPYMPENLGQNQGEILTFSQIVLIPPMIALAVGEGSVVCCSLSLRERTVQEAFFRKRQEYRQLRRTVSVNIQVQTTK